MNRRAVGPSRRPDVDEKFSHVPGPLLAWMLAAAMAVILVVAGPTAQASAIEPVPDEVPATTPADEPPPTDPATTAPPAETRPPITANDFIPEDRDLTSCVGVLERPGCGSESRGGWHQTFVLIAIAFGLVIVFGNVIRGVRKRSAAQQP